MSGFLLASRLPESEQSLSDETFGRAIDAFKKKGMPLTATLSLDGCVLRLFGNYSHDPSSARSSDSEGRFCTYVGTLLYRGLTGRDATAAILDDSRDGGMDCIDSASGSFCLLLNDKDGLHLLTDRAGLHHVYHDDGLSLICNSFLAAVRGCPTQTLQAQEIMEYIQLGTTFGSTTLVREVHLLGSECEVIVKGSRRQVVARPGVWEAGAAPWRDAPLGSRINHAIEVADSYYRQMASAFGNKLTAALSGGYDSRLNLALMRRHDIVPRLFVYGAPSDPDVEIAKLICRSEGLDLDHVHRDSQGVLEPDEYWRNQEDVFHGLDGGTQYGFACEPYEISHRRERVAGGLLAVNGGGGEIWRDFWKLPDKPLRAEEFVRAHYGGRFGGFRSSDKKTLDEFLARLAHKVRAAVGAQDVPLSSAVVQSLYPRFRLRFWQGKNNTVDNHVGLAVTPFSECPFSVPAMWIPMTAKRHGWFEGEIIRRISPKLASYPSAYGHDFQHGPPFAKRLRVNLTCRVPVWLRTLRRRSTEGGGQSRYHTDRYVRARFGSAPLETEKYFDLSQLRSPLALSRALTVERMIRGEWG